MTLCREMIISASSHLMLPSKCSLGDNDWPGMFMCRCVRVQAFDVRGGMCACVSARVCAKTWMFCMILKLQSSWCILLVVFPEQEGPQVLLWALINACVFQKGVLLSMRELLMCLERCVTFIPCLMHCHKNLKPYLSVNQSISCPYHVVFSMFVETWLFSLRQWVFLSVRIMTCCCKFLRITPCILKNRLFLFDVLSCWSTYPWVICALVTR